jgi:hypothetical protein
MVGPMTAVEGIKSPMIAEFPPFMIDHVEYAHVRPACPPVQTTITPCPSFTPSTRHFSRPNL